MKVFVSKLANKYVLAPKVHTKLLEEKIIDCFVV